MTEAVLHIRDVHQQFGALKVLTGISVSVPRGQALGIVGPNGAGKTTLLDIVAGGRRPDRGQVHLSGQDVDVLGVSDQVEVCRRSQWVTDRSGQDRGLLGQHGAEGREGRRTIHM